MGNPYDSGKGDPKGLEDALLGPYSYTYYDKIKSPHAMQMSTDGNFDALTNDVAGLIGYVKVLAYGKSEASTSKGPLGNKYFLQTSAKCYDKNNKKQDRYIYLNNIPDGKFNLFPNDPDMAISDSEYEGLVPGVMEDVLRMNPMLLFQAFVTGSKPKCTEVTLPVGDAGQAGINPPDCDIPGACETHYLLDVDIQSMNDAWFSSSHPKPKVSEGFANWASAVEENNNRHPSDMPKDTIIKLWYGALGLLGLYIY